MTKIKIGGGNSHAFAQARKKSGKAGFVVVLLCIICAPIFPLVSAFFITRLPPPAAKTCYKITMATIYIEVILLLMVAVISFIHDP